MKVFARTPLDINSAQVPRGQVFLIVERCKGCNICVEFCPRSVLQVSRERNEKGYHFPEIVPGEEANCVHCEFCTLICPEFAIFTLSVDGEYGEV